MSVQAVHSSHQVSEAQAVSKAQAVQKHANQQSPIPQDRVTISAEAQAKQTAAAIGADSGRGSK